MIGFKYLKVMVAPMRRRRVGAPLGGRGGPVMSLSLLCLHENPGVLTRRHTELSLGLPGGAGLRQVASGRGEGPNGERVGRAGRGG